MCVCVVVDWYVVVDGVEVVIVWFMVVSGSNQVKVMVGRCCWQQSDNMLIGDIIDFWQGVSCGVLWYVWLVM